MGCHEKFCYIRKCDVQKHYYGVVLHKLLYKVELTEFLTARTGLN